MEREELLRRLKIRARPVIEPVWAHARRALHRLESFQVPIDKLLRGGENKIPAARYADLTRDFLRPSTPVVEGPHVELLREHDRIGDEILAPDVFRRTSYYRNAEQCMKLTGTYFVDDISQIPARAARFIREYRRGAPGDFEPIMVRPIRHSACFEVLNGNHRIARAVLAGKRSVRALIGEREPALTPLQALLLDVYWSQKKKWLDQPLDFPEIRDSWTLMRKCDDRLSMMKDFLSRAGLLKSPDRTYLDIGSSYGWFVKRFEELGFRSFGLERDSIRCSVGFHCYGIRPEQIRTGGIGRLLQPEKERYDVVSLFSLLHHYSLGERARSAEELIRLVDGVTGGVLFMDTAEAHEEAFAGRLSKWTVPFIVAWLKRNTSFTSILPLGTDRDRVAPFHRRHGRTLFACVRG